MAYDLDGTLVDSERVYLNANRQAAADLGYHYVTEDFLPLVGVDERQFATVLADLLQPSEMPMFMANSQAYVDQMMHQPPLMPHVVATLTSVAQAGLSQHVVSSNHRSYVQEVLTRAGIAHFFGEQITYEDVPLAKPAPDGYLLLQQRLKLPATAIVAVEDSPVGVMAAFHAGQKVVQIPDLAPASAHATVILDTIAELPSWLGRL